MGGRTVLGAHRASVASLGEGNGCHNTPADTSAASTSTAAKPTRGSRVANAFAKRMPLALRGSRHAAKQQHVAQQQHQLIEEQRRSVDAAQAGSAQGLTGSTPRPEQSQEVIDTAAPSNAAHATIVTVQQPLRTMPAAPGSPARASTSRTRALTRDGGASERDESSSSRASVTRQNSTSYKGKQRRPAPTREGSVHGAPIGPRVKRSRTELGSKKEQRAAAWRGEKHEYSSMQEMLEQSGFAETRFVTPIQHSKRAVSHDRVLIKGRTLDDLPPATQVQDFAQAETPRRPSAQSQAQTLRERPSLVSLRGLSSLWRTWLPTGAPPVPPLPGQGPDRWLGSPASVESGSPQPSPASHATRGRPPPQPSLLRHVVSDPHLRQSTSSVGHLGSSQGGYRSLIGTASPLAGFMRDPAVWSYDDEDARSIDEISIDRDSDELCERLVVGDFAPVTSAPDTMGSPTFSRRGATLAPPLPLLSRRGSEPAPRGSLCAEPLLRQGSNVSEPVPGATATVRSTRRERSALNLRPDDASGPALLRKAASTSTLRPVLSPEVAQGWHHMHFV